MTRTAIIGLAVVLVGPGCFAADASAARYRAAHAKPGYTAPEKFNYTGEVRASYTIALTDSASEMTGKVSMRIRFSAPLAIIASADRITSETPPFVYTQPVGAITVAVSGSDRAACTFAFDRQLKPRMRLTADAFPQAGSVRLVQKAVKAGYELRLVGYAVGQLPKFATTCNLVERIGPVLDLRGLLQDVLWFDSSESAIAGAWSRASGYAGGVASDWPIVPLLFQQVWPSKPAKRVGGYQFPAPVARLASGKPLTITRNLAREFPVAGAPSVTKTTTGTITFSFKPRR